ncbi:hypothetical protein FACS1894147_06680 [Spirochaetia bacterium]|nr:hypothetical protein FACS1894147_06680 [Spirochaetia bacterium]
MTDYLFARPSFIEGVARNADLFGALNVYNTSPDGVMADLRALQADLKTLQKDFDVAYKQTISVKQH